MFSSHVVLPPYHNPPYRNPISRDHGSSMATPSSTSEQQPNRPSPKRKRTGPTGTPKKFNRPLTPEQVPLTAATLDTSLPSGASSPRSKVAERLKELDLRHHHQQQQSEISISEDSSPNSAIKTTSRKRVKRTSDESITTTPPSRSPLKESVVLHDGDDPPFLLSRVAEVNETPYCRRRLQPSFTSTGFKSECVDRTASAETFENEGPKATDSRSPSLSPLSSPIVTAQADRAMSPLPQSEDLAPDQAALTWQDDEITGHEIDVSGDDDGEGINGIGFKPTPAQAYARQQRRKQQVNDWRAREAREARQRRIERRRGSSIARGVDQTKSEGATAKRSVRFAEVG